MMTVEMNRGQMVDDVRRAVNGKIKVEHFGRYGGVSANPNEILEALQKQIIGG